jgi:pyruvate ferredoxin oxidoreductase gamma subunit
LAQQTEILKQKNEYGYYEIRMESVGGQGANLAGKILADAGILHMGLNGVNFASYGSEKKGTPVKSFIKFSEPDRDIRVNSPVVEPHLLVVFHTNLAGKVAVMQGVKPGAAVIVNTPKKCDEVRDLLQVPGGVTLYCVDAMKISVEEKVRINTTIMGTICRAVDFLTKDAVHASIKDIFGHKYPHLLEPNLNAFERGHEEVDILEVPDDGKYPVQPFTPFRPKLGWKNAPIGGVIPNPGNTALNDMSMSRSGFYPVWHEDLCINCGECDSVCPDQAMIFVTRKDDKGEDKRFMTGVNLQYCKGCMRCVDVCPKQALTAERETE